MGHYPHALIDLSALRHNLLRVRSAAPASRVLAVIKANAYGHGIVRIARALEEADALAVARISEAIQLRREGIEKPLVVLEGCCDSEELSAASRYGLELLIHRPGQIDLLEQQSLKKPVTCWLKADTGMHRLGFPIEAVERAWQRLNGCASVVGGVRLMTHLANADDLRDETTDRQLQRFRALAARLGVETSIANSAGILGWPPSHTEWVRPGIMLYGASPFLHGHAKEDGLLPVMTLRSRLIAVNRHFKGEGIGYGGSWICPEEMDVGVVAIGYGDGYPRHAPFGTPVLLNGQRVLLVGRVSMDMITVDLRSQPQARVGDRVVLWGAGLPVEEIAEAAATIPYQLFCGVTRRVELVDVGT